MHIKVLCACLQGLLLRGTAMNYEQIEVAPFHLEMKDYQDMYSHCGSSGIDIKDVEPGTQFTVKFHGPNGWSEAPIKLRPGQALAKVVWTKELHYTYPTSATVYRCRSTNEAPRQWWNPYDLAPPGSHHKLFWYVPDPNRVGFCT